MKNKRLISADHVFVPFAHSTDRPENPPLILYFGRHSALDYRSGYNGDSQITRLEESLKSLGAHRAVFVPDASSFNAVVAPPREFKKFQFTKVKVGAPFTKVLRNGVMADGTTLLHKHTAVMICSGDCPTVTFMVPDGRVIVVHAGRWSLFDKSLVLKGQPGREYPSVVNSVMAEISRSMRRRTFVYISLGIRSRHFTHPLRHKEYGALNRALIKHIKDNYGPVGLWDEKGTKGRIDLFAIIRAQCVRAGINPAFIADDGLDTHSDDRFYSHRRETDLGKTSFRPRNAVVVIKR